MDIIKIYGEIQNELGKFSFKRTSLSYQYLIDAIFILTQDRMAMRDFNKYVYPKIAQKYETKPENVLWCITKLLKVMYLNTDASVISEYFGIAIGENPSAKAFIIQISGKVLEKFGAGNDFVTDFLQILL